MKTKRGLKEFYRLTNNILEIIKEQNIDLYLRFNEINDHNIICIEYCNEYYYNPISLFQDITENLNLKKNSDKFNNLKCIIGGIYINLATLNYIKLFEFNEI